MKNKLLLLFTISLTTMLSACATNAKTVDTLPSESESGFYEGSTEIKPSFELLVDEMTLECGTPFDTDDLSKYIKANNYDNILINIFYTEKTKSSIDRYELSEQHWDDMDLKPQVYEIVFIDYNTNYEATMLLKYQDTQTPTPKIVGNSELNYYQLELIGSEMLGYEIRKKSEDYSDEMYSIDLSDGSFFIYFESLVELPPHSKPSYKEMYILLDDKKIKDGDSESIIKECPNPGSYTLEFCVTDFADNIGTAKFTLNIIEDIAPEYKEALSEEEYQTLYNNYLSQQ